MKVLVKVISSRLFTGQEVKEREHCLKASITHKNRLCVNSLTFRGDCWDLWVWFVFFFLSKMHLTNTLVEKQEMWIHIGKNKNFPLGNPLTDHTELLSLAWSTSALLNRGVVQSLWRIVLYHHLTLFCSFLLTANVKTNQQISKKQSKLSSTKIKIQPPLPCKKSLLLLLEIIQAANDPPEQLIELERL